MAKGFLKGVVGGGIASAVALASVSLISPLPAPPVAVVDPPQRGSSPTVAPAPTVAPSVAAGPRPTGAAPILGAPLPATASDNPLTTLLPAVPPVVGPVLDRQDKDTSLPAQEDAVAAVRPAIEKGGPPDGALNAPGRTNAPPPSSDDAPATPPPAAAPIPRVANPEQPEAPQVAIGDPAGEATGLPVTPEDSDRPTAPLAPGRMARDSDPGISEAPVPAAPLLQDQSSAPRPQVILDADRSGAQGDGAPVAAPTLPAGDDRAVIPGQPLKPLPPAPATAPDNEVSRPAEPLPRPETKVRVNQLPQLGVTRSDSGPVFTSAGPAQSLPSARSLAPVDRFAMRWDRPADQPRLAIVLMDGGQQGGDLSARLSALRALPFPVSVAVDALLPDAASRMAAYRGSGFEVLANVDFPPGARARDAEVSMSAALAAMPEVFAVLEGAGAGVQTTLEASSHVAAVLADSGHGFVARNRGLNTAHKRALSSGVPSVVISRDMGAEMTEADIGRLLDQAAFRAEREGAVVLRGHLQPETLAALRAWGATSRAARIVVVPVSNLLDRQTYGVSP